MQIVSTSWYMAQKMGFRFIFLFLGISTLLAWDLMLYFCLSGIGIKYNPEAPYAMLEKPFYWLDRHIFRTGYLPPGHRHFPGDNHFGVVFYLALALLAIIGAMVWTFLDKQRVGYDRLQYWFRLFIRLTLGMAIIGYGLDKLIPVQMSYPSLITQITPYGEFSRFEILWNFMGVSPGYMMLTGFAEIVAGILVLFRRTIVLGCLMNLFILINVVAFNFFYNVPVKLFSSQLLLYTVYLIYPYVKPLFQLFVEGQVVSFREPVYQLRRGWKRTGFLSLLLFIPLLITFLTGRSNIRRYHKEREEARNEKMYEVESFVVRSGARTDSLAPLLTDTLRWKRCLFAFDNGMVVCNMKDGKDYFRYKVDSVQKAFIDLGHQDSLTWTMLHYAYPDKDHLQLSGIWKGRDISVAMRSIPADSLLINKEKTDLIGD